MRPFVKNMPGALLWLLLPLHLALNLAAIAFFVKKGQGRVTLRVQREALRGLPRMWKKRRYTQTCGGRRFAKSGVF